MTGMDKGISESPQPAPSIKFTYDDFLLFPDDGKRHELIDGEHYVTPSPLQRHQSVTANVFFHIRLWLEEHHNGRVWFAPLDVVLSNFDVVVPDVLYATKARLEEISDPRNLRGAP